MVLPRHRPPGVPKFINWKADEEKKVAALIAAGYPSDFNGDAYATVSGQNSNNSVRVSEEFLEAVQRDGDWHLRWRTDPSHISATIPARELWRQIAEAAWQCADPGLQFDTTINDWHTSPEAGRINGSNPCVTGDTLVATAAGYRRIADLVGDHVEIVACDGQPSNVTRIFPTGIKPVYRLRTRSGYSLRLTADHRVMTANRGDVPAINLRAGDNILLRGAGFGSRSLGREIAEFLGAAVGDGCQTGKQGQVFITVGKSERVLAETLLQSLARFTEGSEDGRARRARSVVETPTSLRVGSSAAPLRGLVARYTVIDRGAAEKQFTDEVFSLDRASQAALLRGLFTADGTVADYGEKSQFVSLDSTSLALLEQVQLMLLSFGVKAKLYLNRLPGSEQEMPGGVYRRQTMHSLRISRSSRVIFEREIGFMSESPKSAQLAFMNARVTTYADRFEDEFASIEYSGDEPVYDLTEPRTNHFVANGMVVHNCSEYMFLDNTACNLSSLNLLKFLRRRDRAIRRRGVPPRRATLDHRARDQRADGAVPQRGDRAPLLRLPHPRSRLRQSGHRPHAAWHAVRLRPGPCLRGGADGAVTGESYAASAEMASHLGPFPGFAANREHMLRVIRNHRRAAYDVPAEEYEQLSVVPMPIAADQVPGYLLDAARESWDRALADGERSATATPRRPCWPRPARSGCSWTATPPASSPTSRW